MAKPNEVSELEVIRSKNADEILQELFDEQKALHDRRRQEEESENVIKQSASGNGPEHKSADDILNELFTELGQKQPNDSIDSFLNSGKKKKKHKDKEKDKSKKKKDKEKVKKAKEKDESEESSKKRKRKVRSGSENEKLDNKKKEKGKSGDDEQRGKFKMIRSDEESSKRKKSREKSSKDIARKHSSCAKDVDVEEGEIVDAKRGHSSKSRSHDRTESSDVHIDNAKGRRRRQSRSPSVSPVSKRVCPPRSGDKYDNYRDAKRRLSDDANYDDGEFSKERSVRRAPPRSFDHHDNRFRDHSRTSPEPFHGLDRPHHSKYHDDRRRGRRSSHEDYDRRGRPLSARHSRSRSRSRSRRPYAEVFDKVKLLEIARRNATLLMKNGVLPTDIFSKDQIVAIKAGGKSVEELTSYCRRLARKEGLAEGDPDFSGPDSDGGEGGHFIHHPFVVKERPMPQITLNIRNAIPLPVRTPQELAIENAVRKTQFPVSSGTQHRYKEVKELEWKEVETPAAKEVPKAVQEMSIVPLSTPTVNAVANEVEVVPIPLPPPPQVPAKPDFEPISSPVDVGSVITARLKAIRALKENPEDTTAKRELNSAVQEMDRWAEAKALEPKFLTVSELTTGPQAWAKRDQLKNAKEVASGMGMHLLQKMGWKPGEGLGKNKEGTTEPLALDVKTDKKGLTSQEDLKQKGPFANLTMLYDLSGKHPVSALMELCTKRRWGPPVFDLCFEHGPPHQKSFVFKVTVNGVEYQPCIATNNKKLAKANAAAFCLQSLGLLKTSPAPAATGTLQTVPAMPVVTVPDANFVASHQLQTVPNQ